MSPSRDRGLPSGLHHHGAALLVAAGRLAAGVTRGELTVGYQSLSRRYRAGGRTPRRLRPRELAAYAVARLPATLAANADVLGRLRAARPHFSPRLLVDIGAGLGSSAVAAAALFPTIEDIICIDDSPVMRRAGAAVARTSTLPAVRRARWLAPGEAAAAAVNADLVTASYVLGELKEPTVAVAGWWQDTGDTLVVIEPGTPAGYRTVLAAREWLVDAGAFIAAPCPHHAPCPLVSPDWCHFASVVDRSPGHRAVKGGALTTEDEKFSYLVVARTPVAAPAPRIIAPPARRPGHVRLRVCTTGGVVADAVVGRSEPAWGTAKRLRWGDTTGWLR